MPGTGNDIVSLEAINLERSNWPELYTRILSPSELERHSRQDEAGLPFILFLWLSWSIKESVYKFVQRKEHGLGFSPTKILVQDILPPVANGEIGDNYWTGIADFRSTTFYFRSSIREEYISTVVQDHADFSQTHWGARAILESDHAHQSQAVRAFALEGLNNFFPGESLQIAKNPLGYPMLMAGDRELNIPLSLSHHGRFVAYSFFLNA